MEMECKQPLYFHKLKFEINIPFFIHNHEGQSTNSETETTKRGKQRIQYYDFTFRSHSIYGYTRVFCICLQFI